MPGGKDGAQPRLLCTQLLPEPRLSAPHPQRSPALGMPSRHTASRCLALQRGMWVHRDDQGWARPSESPPCHLHQDAGPGTSVTCPPLDITSHTALQPLGCRQRLAVSRPRPPVSSLSRSPGRTVICCHHQQMPLLSKGQTRRPSQAHAGSRQLLQGPRDLWRAGCTPTMKLRAPPSWDYLQSQQNDTEATSNNATGK